MGTFALGTAALYDFLDQNPAIEMLPVDYVNDPRIIGQEDCFVSINATTEVDLVGQCASETVGGAVLVVERGQADFARGAMYSPHGRAFVVLPSTARAAARVPHPRGVDDRVDGDHDQEHGRPDRHRVRRGRDAAARSPSGRALISIAHPDFREELTAEGRALGYL